MAKKPIFVVDEQVIPDCLTDFLSREDFRAKGAETIRRTSAELEGGGYRSMQLCFNGVSDWLKKANFGSRALQKKGREVFSRPFNLRAKIRIYALRFLIKANPPRPSNAIVAGSGIVPPII